MNNECCGNCRFLVTVGNESACHWGPPTVYMKPVQVLQTIKLIPDAAWPPVIAEKWCGRWEASFTPQVSEYKKPPIKFDKGGLNGTY